MKGIILAGGTGSRLWPITQVVSKQLLPIHDKPMVYYPLATLMLAGIREILIITTPHDAPQFRSLLGDGGPWGVELSYAEQPRPDGLAQAFLIGRDFIAGERCALILGDNIFYGQGLTTSLTRAANSPRAPYVRLLGARSQPLRGHRVRHRRQVRAIVEKPKEPPSTYAVTGLYFYDERVVEIAATLKPSPRGELEITDLNNCYLECGSALGREAGPRLRLARTGTPESLVEAAEFVATVEPVRG